MCAYRAASARAACEDDQNRADRALDVAVAGEPLAALGDPTVLGGGAHEPTPTPCWILDDLLGGLSFEQTDHLLDVGCGAGRVLAYAAATQLPCRVTGIELDGRLAARAASWTRGRDGLEVIAGSALDIPLGAYTHFYLFNPFDQVLLVEFLDLEVIAGSALDIPLGAYTHFYLFNPFDQVLLVEFLDRLEAQVRRSITLVHMSDNGESFAYLGRAGWMREREGSFYEHPAGGFPVFGYPQHYSIWRYVPDANGASFAYLGRAGWMREREGSFYEHPAGGFPVFGYPQHYSIWRYVPDANGAKGAPVV